VEAMVSVSAWASDAASAAMLADSSPAALPSSVSALSCRSAFGAKELLQLLLATDKARPKSLILGQPSELKDPRNVLLHFAGRSSVVVGE